MGDAFALSSVGGRRSGRPAVIEVGRIHEEEESEWETDGMTTSLWEDRPPRLLRHASWAERLRHACNPRIDRPRNNQRILIASLLLIALLLVITAATTNTASTGTDHTTIVGSSTSTVCRVNVSQPLPPKRTPEERRLHGDTVVDEFAWIRRNDDNDALQRYIDAENNYADAVFSSFNATLLTLLTEMSDAYDTMSQSLNVFDTAWFSHRYFYFLNTTESSDDGWPTLFQFDYSGPPTLTEAFKQVDRNRAQLRPVLDFSRLNLSDDTSLGAVVVSPDDQVVAVSVDTIGNERYDILFWNVSSSSLLFGGKNISGTDGTVLFAGPSWALYVALSEDTNVPKTVYRLCITNCGLFEWVKPFRIENKRPLKGSLAYDVTDEKYYPALELSADGKYLLVKSVGQTTTDIRYMPVENAGRSNFNDALQQIWAPRTNVYYDLEHNNGTFYVRSNHEHPNFGIYTWRNGAISPFLVPSNDRFVEDMEMYSTFLAVWCREEGLRKVRMYPLNSSSPFLTVDGFSSRVYQLQSSDEDELIKKLNRNYNGTYFIYSNMTFLQPPRMYEIDVASKTTTTVQHASFSIPDNEYQEERILVSSYDNLTIPVDIVYKKPLILNGSRPLLLNAYGAYAGYNDAVFQPEAFSLLNRNFIIAVAHPRGDNDNGATWYTQGKYDLKINTFLDVRSVLRYFVATNYTRPDLVAFRGRSAGGLLAGQVATWLGAQPSNTTSVDPILRGTYPPLLKKTFMEAMNRSHPDNRLVKVVVGEVAFVDPVHDMSDPTVPWTPFDMYEWGDPKTNKTIYEAMMDYSPYEILRNQTYPALFLSTGYLDSRVDYREVVKYMAKLRLLKSNPSCVNGVQVGTPLILTTGQGGHFDAESVLGRAKTASFVLDVLGLQ